MRMLCLIALSSLGVPALAQDAAAPAQAADVDEIVVPGRRPENLRMEIERLETAVYDRWNALNSNDELDIHCMSQAPTGSNIPLRTCAPNFVIQAEARAASGSVSGARARGDTRNPADRAVRLEEKSRELTEEMQRVAREDKELLRDLVRLDELRQMQAAEKSEAR